MCIFIVAGNEVIRRWKNVRDAFAKSCKKLQESWRSGSGASTHKKYVFNDQLQFLKKLYDTRQTADSFEENDSQIVHEDGEITETPGGSMDNCASQATTAGRPASGQQRGSKRRRTLDEVELRMLKALEHEKPNRHLSFFQGVLPSLEKFNEHEVLQFQMGVLQVIANINQQKLRTSQLPSFYSQPPSLSSQPPSFYSQPSSFPSQPLVMHFQPPPVSQPNFLPQSVNHQQHDHASRETITPQPTQSASQNVGQMSAAPLQTATLPTFTSSDSYFIDSASPGSQYTSSSSNTIDFSTN